MTAPQDARLLGAMAVDGEDSDAGQIRRVYFDDQTGLPLWITVAIGVFGTQQSSQHAPALHSDAHISDSAAAKTRPVRQLAKRRKRRQR